MNNSVVVNVRLSSFRRRGVVWGLLAFFFCSFLPSVSIAQQQETVTISTLQGTVLVNNHTEQEGAVLKAGDVIETMANAFVILELSDESTVRLDEKTKLDIAVLIQQPETEVRTSRLKLLYGRIRVLLSGGHQREGSAFTVETPNAHLGVKFSQPMIEVRYDPNKQETIGIAYTVEIEATNLISGEIVLVPVGSTVIINSDEMKVLAFILKDGMGMGTKIAIGVGAVVVAGAGIALAAGSGGDSGGDSPERSFVGTFRDDYVLHNGDFKQQTYDLGQDGASVSGTLTIILDLSNTNGCRKEVTLPFAGTVENGTLSFSLPATEECCCSTCCIRIGGGNYTGTIGDNGGSFTVTGPLCDSAYDGCGLYLRQ